MPDASLSVHPPPFAYDDSVYQAAAKAAKARSRGLCQVCGRKLPLEAHHYAKPYPPAHKTSPNDLTGLCGDCHDDGHIIIFFERAGGSREELRAAMSEIVATLLLRPEAQRLCRSHMRVGRAVWCEGWWAALVTGGSRPRIGEVFRLFLRSRCEWRDVVVTEVVDGRPGCWRVRKRFLGDGDDVRLMCVNTVCAEQPVPSAMRQSAA